MSTFCNNSSSSESSPAGEEGKIYISSDTFAGQRDGYYFGKGSRGLGYYINNNWESRKNTYLHFYKNGIFSAQREFLTAYEKDLEDLVTPSGHRLTKSGNESYLEMAHMAFRGRENEYLELEFTKEDECHVCLPWLNPIIVPSKRVDGHRVFLLPNEDVSLSGDVDQASQDASRSLEVKHNQPSYPLTFVGKVNIGADYSSVSVSFRGKEFFNNIKWTENFCVSKDKKYLAVVENWEDNGGKEDPSIVIYYLSPIYDCITAECEEDRRPFRTFAALVKQRQQQRSLLSSRCTVDELTPVSEAMLKCLVGVEELQAHILKFI